MDVTIEDMANALAQLRKDNGYMYSPPECIILDKAIELKRKQSWTKQM
jgi:hypothetical protein